MSRYIDADAFVADSKWCGLETAEQVLFALDHQPTIDIVRCKECKHYDKFPTWSACTYWSGDPYEQASVNDDDFCSYGEREGE